MDFKITQNPVAGESMGSINKPSPSGNPDESKSNFPESENIDKDPEWLDSRELNIYKELLGFKNGLKF